MTRPNDALFAWREEQHLSQEEAAGQLGVSQGTWGAWETGTKRPDLHNALALERLSEGALRAADWARPRKAQRRRVKRTGTEG